MKKLVLLALISTPALAQEDAPTEDRVEVQFKPRTNIDFENAVKVDGTLLGPDLKMVTPPPRSKDFNPLIRLRQTFAPEMKASVDAVK